MYMYMDGSENSKFTTRVVENPKKLLYVINIQLKARLFYPSVDNCLRQIASGSRP